MFLQKSKCMEHAMGNSRAGEQRPRTHFLAPESDLVADLALQAEHRNPVVAAMLLEEIERGQLYDAETLPKDAVTLGSNVDFVDDKTHQLRKVQLVLPGNANIAEGRISILTPMGAALYGLRAGDSINWPDLDGNERRITLVRVVQHDTSAGAAPSH
jgi:regulator of nucleoside diphosphate kinase